LAEVRYILFNQRHRAVRLGWDNCWALGVLKKEAEKLGDINGDVYRIYDKQKEKNVYFFPDEEAYEKVIKEMK